MGYSSDVVDYTRRCVRTDTKHSTIMYGCETGRVDIDGQWLAGAEMRPNYRFDGIYNAHERKVEKIESGLCVQGLIL